MVLSLSLLPLLVFSFFYSFPYVLGLLVKCFKKILDVCKRVITCKEKHNERFILYFIIYYILYRFVFIYSEC